MLNMSIFPDHFPEHLTIFWVISIKFLLKLCKNTDIFLKLASEKSVFSSVDKVGLVSNKAHFDLDHLWWIFPVCLLGPQPEEQYGTRAVLGLSDEIDDTRWSAAVSSPSGDTVCLSVCAAPDAPIGRYVLTLDGHIQFDFILLFNPWCPSEWKQMCLGVPLAHATQISCSFRFTEETDECVYSTHDLIYRRCGLHGQWGEAGRVRSGPGWDHLQGRCRIPSPFGLVFWPGTNKHNYTCSWSSCARYTELTSLKT